jgi:hypothetical protein
MRLYRRKGGDLGVRYRPRYRRRRGSGLRRHRASEGRGSADSEFGRFRSAGLQKIPSELLTRWGGGDDERDEGAVGLQSVRRREKCAIRIHRVECSFIDEVCEVIGYKHPRERTRSALFRLSKESTFQG